MVLKAQNRFCPNCWGHFEYGSLIRTKSKDKQVDINNRRRVRNFIENFVTKHVSGVRLKAQKDSYHCPTCQTNYRTIDGTE